MSEIEGSNSSNDGGLELGEVKGSLEGSQTSQNLQSKGEKANEGSESTSSSEVEEDDDEELTTKTSPYHLLGGICFIAAIVIGITCVIATALLYGNMPNRNIRWVFGSLMGCFFFFLFLCLCCTYYLGASKESWETPAFTGIHRNFSNVVALAGIIVEFIQICSFSFKRNTRFGGQPIYYINYIAVPVLENNASFEYIYWIMFAIAFLPYIFVIIIRIVINVYTVRKGESAAANMVDKVQEKIHSVLWFLVNVFYFPVIGTMISGSDCTWTDAAITLDAYESIQCLRGKHIAFLICSMLALVTYYPAASFAQAQTQSISDIKFKPRIVFIMLQGKFLLALIAIFFTDRDSVYFTFVLILNVLFLGLNILGKPCLVIWVNRMRTVLFAMTIWATIVNCIAIWGIDDGQNSFIPPVILFVVWGVLVVGIPIFFAIWDRVHATEESLPQ